MNQERQSVNWIVASLDGAGEISIAQNHPPHVAGCHASVNADILTLTLAEWRRDESQW